MKSSRMGAAVLALVLATAACSTDGDAGVIDIPVGDASAFCLGWPGVRVVLQSELGDTTRDWEIRGNVEVARLTLDEADTRVPAALRSDWTSATRFQDTVITLLEIAGYNPEQLPVQLIDAAFGEGGVEAAVALSDDSIARIDAWALDECGDFCELWPRLDRALGWDGEGGGDTHESFRNGGPQDKGSILSADVLVPAAVRDDWNEASAIKLRLVDLYTSDIEELGHQEFRDLLEEAAGFGNPEGRAFQAVIEEFGEPPPDVDHIFWAANAVSTARREAIGAWVADNCESVGVSGLPGVVRVADPGRNPDRLLIAVVPVGTDLGEIEDASDFLAVACASPRRGEVWASPLFERNSGFEQPCIDGFREDLGARSAVLPAGDYELFIGSFSRGVGNFDTYVPAPDLCAFVPLTVDGDTDVTVPDLEPCDLGPLAGTPEEIARRQPPSDTAGTTGTLRVTLTEYLSDEGVHTDYRLAVLPAGTTLNQIALGGAWPAGVGCMSVDRPIDADLDRDYEDRQAEFDEAERHDAFAAEERQRQREQLERQLAQLQVESEELERHEAELDGLSGAEREEADRQIAEQWEQIFEWQAQLSEQQAGLESEDDHAAAEAANREEQRREMEAFAYPIREAMAGGGIPVPILPFPVDPQNIECGGGPYEYLGLNDDGWTGPEPARLPAADYDVYVFVERWNEEMGDEPQRQCATLTASVEGETLVKAPPLEDCP